MSNIKINGRYLLIDYDGQYYITNTKHLAFCYQNFLEKYKGEVDQKEFADEEWNSYLVENSMTGEETVKHLNRVDKHLKDIEIVLDIINKKTRYALTKNEVIACRNLKQLLEE